jgi:spore coat polysaccharide biosynthesis predicted glycosyltransferase SpsG
MNSKTLWLRVDGGAAIGLGHVARALALAEEAAGRGLRPRFALNDDDAARALVRRRGFADVATAPPTLDEEVRFLVDAVGGGPLVTDLRDKDPAFYRRLREAGVWTCAVDDMGEPITAHVVVNGGAAAGFARCEELWPPQRFLVGTAYIPLPPAFAEEPPAADDPGRTRLLVTFGGTDADDYTRRALAALSSLAPLDVDLALGPAYPFVDEARALAAEGSHRVEVHAPAADMLPFYRRARLALAAGGITQYELLSCGVPTVSVPHVAREEAECAAFAEAGAVATFPPAELAVGGAVVGEVKRLWGDAGRRRAMAAAGRRLVDGRGAVRVIDAIAELAP